jgi:hypothetical protein
VPASLRAFIPRALRRRAAGPVGEYRGARLRNRLAGLASSGRTIVAGPWLGEVGFEILYWAPFVRWFASSFNVTPERLIVLSRGGTRSWYGQVTGRYCDVFDYVSADAYKDWQTERVGELGEQKQTRITTRERELLDRVRETIPGESDILHPSLMYELMRPYWFSHLDERWIHRHTVYRRLERPARVAALKLPDRYVAAKFYFNDCFPATDENRAFVHRVFARLAGEGPVVSLSTGVTLDDHGAFTDPASGVVDIAGSVPPSRNLDVQSAIVANASAFVGTYGGFAYLAPFYGVPSTSYYDDPSGFAQSHLHMARSAFASIGMPDLLQVRSTTEPR